MSGYVPAALRRQVRERATGLCEYCLIHESDTFVGCQVEHVIAEKHGGATTLENLAYACAYCNRAKGTDIASVSPKTGQLSRLFNPRTDLWRDHFKLEGVVITARSEVGEATVHLLNLNHPDRLVERKALRAIRRYPTAAARNRIGE